MTSGMRNNLRTSAWCASAVGGTILLAGCFRATIARIFNSQWGDNFQNRAMALAILSIAFFFIWFLFVFLCLVCGASRPVSNPCKFDGSKENVSSGGRTMFRRLGYVVSSALVLAITLSIILQANDYLFFSRLLPWIPSLIWLQACGFRVASRMFPCQSEGFVTGCEAYKWFPAFLLSNGIAYFPFLFLGALLYFRSPYIRLVWPRIWRSIIRYGALIGSLGLCTRLLVHNIEPSIALPTRPIDLEQLAWIVSDNVTGITALLLFLLVPFCAYRLLRALRLGTCVRSEAVDLTWLASFTAVALLLGNQFLAE